MIATFGRGFYVLDDYSPLRRLTPEGMDPATALLPVRNAWMFVPSLPYGWKGKGFLGESFYAAPNPPFGAVFTYYLKDGAAERPRGAARAGEDDREGRAATCSIRRGTRCAPRTARRRPRWC